LSLEYYSSFIPNKEVDSIAALASALNTPLPTILVIAGVAFWLLAIAGSIAGKITVLPDRQKTAGVVGTLLVVLGIVTLYLAPDKGSDRPSSQTASVLSSSMQTSPVTVTAPSTGVVPSPQVYGAIGEKWVQLGGDGGFGAPISGEEATTRGRVSFFADGGAIYWSGATGAHEVHGLIAKTYREAGGDASCLGLPVSDEEPKGAGRLSRFEHGQIDWQPGDTRGRITCR
jgi:LGFP repeat